MSIFGKLKFWKRGDDLSLGDELAMPKGAFPQDELGLQSPGLPQTPQMPLSEPGLGGFREARQPYAQQQYYSPNRDIDLVVAKLDALRATLENINQRLANLERVAYGEEETRRRGW